ncbi:SRPBCC family protein [Devosia sediminis]|uniref:SRPBCC family protein n=1 Tax=Devosia sediminis TaxID=2798801 RepID=A0A934IVY2_9HYPH|nr:SRPBCC family protein [Devosia sediminis]MBJ3783793.1 SRPBCC family protein [Devosia sediminis]
MNDRQQDAAPAGGTVVKRVSDLELAVTRVFDAPPRIVFQAWTDAALFKRWWAPKSMGMVLRSVEMDVRTGGTYRLEFGSDAENTFAFFGKYLEVVPPSKLVWTNEEDPDGGISTVTFEEQGGKTLVTFSETYPSAEALEAYKGGLDGTPEQFAQLDEVLAEMGASGG